MQIKIYNTNDIASKLKTRSLYEECFDENKSDYISYYYDEIIKRNSIVVMEDNDTVVSMVHLNPYEFNIDDDLYTLHYFVAVATKKEYRNKGIMTKVLNAAFELLKNNREPFCYLVPENNDLEKMYNKVGFESVCKFTYDKFSKEKYDIYPVKNEEYIKLMKTEQKYLDMEPEEYKEDLKKKNVMIKILDSNFKYTIDELKNKKICICQEV